MDNTDLICQVVENEPDDTPATGGVAITAVTKLKHAALWAAVKKYGSQSEVARRLKVSDISFSSWVTLKHCPPTEPKGRWTARRLAALDKRFIKICGEPMATLFPPELRQNVAFMRSPKYFERTAIVHAAALEAHANATRDRLLEQSAEPLARLEWEEQHEVLKHALETVLNEKERFVVKSHFGLDDDAKPTGYSMTFKEIGEALGLSVERARQIENKALRKLQEATNPTMRRLREVWS